MDEEIEKAIVETLKRLGYADAECSGDGRIRYTGRDGTKWGLCGILADEMDEFGEF